MLYHLSRDNNLKTLTPRIPECAIAIYEDVETPRICFSDFIGGCLSALQEPDTYCVYVPEQEVDEADIYIPTGDEVRDAKINHEVWVMREVNVKYIGTIRARNYDWKEHYDVGSGKESITFFHYPYEWIEA